MQRVAVSPRAWAAAAATGAGLRATVGGDSEIARCDSNGDALGNIMCWSIASVLATEALYDYMYASRRPATSTAVDASTRKEDAGLPAPPTGGSKATGRVLDRRAVVPGTLEGTAPPVAPFAISLGTVAALSAAAAAVVYVVAGRQQARANIPAHRSKARTSSRPGWAATSVTVLQRQRAIDARRVAWRSRPGLVHRDAGLNSPVPVKPDQAAVSEQEQMSASDMTLPSPPSVCSSVSSPSKEAVAAEVPTTPRTAITVLQRQQAIDARRAAWRSRPGLAQRRTESNGQVSAGTGQGQLSRRPILYRGEGLLRQSPVLPSLPTSGLFHYALDDSQPSSPKHVAEIPQLVQNGSLHAQSMVWWEGADNWMMYADCVGILSDALNATRPRLQTPVRESSRQVDVLALLNSAPPRGSYSYSEPLVRPRLSSRQSRERRLPVLNQGSIQPASANSS